MAISSDEVAEAEEDSASPISPRVLCGISRGLRVLTDLGCAALVVRGWLGHEPRWDVVFPYWMLSQLVFPHRGLAERVRNRPEIHRGLLALGLVIALGLFGATSGRPCQGLMLAFTGASNSLAARARAPRHTSVGSVLFGLAALAAGAAWVWLAVTQSAAGT